MEQKTARLYLNMILKEDEPLDMVRRSLDSIKPYVDGMYITVTYNEKEPQDSELVKYLESEKVNVSFFKWVKDFAVARNFAMDKVPHGPLEFVYWQDADDVLRGGENLKTIVQNAVNLNVAAWYFHYWYNVELDEKGDIREVLVDQKRERVIRNDYSFKWVSKLHEILIEQRTENVIKMGIDDTNTAVVIHLSNSDRMDKNIDRNIEILENQAAEEQHKDPRTIIYLARSYYDKGKMINDKIKSKIYLDLALTLFHEYLEGSGKPGEEGYHEGSGWREERGTAWSSVAEIAILMGNLDIAAQAYESAIHEAYEFPMYYISLASVYLMKGDIKRAKHWLKLASEMDEPNTTIITTPRDMKLRTLEIDYEISINEGKFEQASQDLDMMIKINPANEEYKKRKQTVADLDKSNKVAQSLVYIGKYIEEFEPEGTKKDKLESLVKSIPQSIEEEPIASQMQHLFLSPKNWADDEIAILCGPGMEEWSPNSLKTGIGGSEQAVIYLAQELKKLGWKVTVYANPGVDSGMHDGVYYTTWHKLNPKDNFNVLIMWRSIGFVDFEPKAKFSMVWMHDVPNNPDFTEKRIDKVDKIAVLSEFHKSLLRVDRGGYFEPMPESKVFLTSNGLAPVSINKKWKRNPHKLIYSSSPDRGLVYLLNMWPDIIKEVPDAELHIFYGFNVFDKIHDGAPGKNKFKDQIVALMKQPGITYHGRVSANELHREQVSSGIWAYPTHFDEISCITAMEAQAYGAVPVTTTVGAVNETVRNGIKVDVDIMTQEGQKEYKEQLIKLLKDEKTQEEIRKPMMEWAKDYFQWSSVAKEWDREMRINLQNPDIKYHTTELGAKEVDK